MTLERKSWTERVMCAEIPKRDSGTLQEEGKDLPETGNWAHDKHVQKLLLLYWTVMLDFILTSGVVFFLNADISFMDKSPCQRRHFLLSAP